VIAEEFFTASALRHVALSRGISGTDSLTEMKVPETSLLQFSRFWLVF